MSYNLFMLRYRDDKIKGRIVFCNNLPQIASLPYLPLYLLAPAMNDQR